MKYLNNIINIDELNDFNSKNTLKDEFFTNPNAVQYLLKQYMQGYHNALFITHFLTNDNLIDKWLQNEKNKELSIEYKLFNNTLIERTFDLETIAAEAGVQITDGPYCKIFTGNEENLEQFRQNLVAILHDNKKDLDINFDDIEEDITPNDLNSKQIENLNNSKQNKKHVTNEKKDDTKKTIKKKIIGKKIKFKKVKIKDKIKEKKKTRTLEDIIREKEAEKAALLEKEEFAKNNKEMEL
jgi:hypothetical protein